MTDRPILFSAPMVRALIEGRKTQTRRILKGVPEWCDTDRKPGYSCLTPPGHIEFRGHYPGDDQVEAGYGSKFIKLPYLKGDRLYVREAWAPLSACTTSDPGSQALAERGFYRADNSTIDGEISRWRPGIHQPRWASRLTLTVTNVRVERLNDCSEADAQAEGVDMVARRNYRDGYAVLWNSINGPGAWEANPWVVAVTFTVEQRNIDA